MISKKVRYGQLDEWLTSLGYDRECAPTHVIYRKKAQELPIILPKMSKREEVTPSHLAVVERILMLDGVIGVGHFVVATTPGRKLAKPKAPRSKGRNGSVPKIERG